MELSKPKRDNCGICYNIDEVLDNFSERRHRDLWTTLAEIVESARDRHCHGCALIQSALSHFYDLSNLRLPVRTKFKYLRPYDKYIWRIEVGPEKQATYFEVFKRNGEVPIICRLYKMLFLREC